MGMLDDAEIGKRFDRHRQTENTAPAFELVHTTVKITASVLNQVLPPGRKAALALTALEEALMHANGAIACEAGPDWQLPHVEVPELLDDLAEHLEGPLHLRSGAVGGGGPVDGPNGGDIGPEAGRIGPTSPVEPVNGAERLLRGDCPARVPDALLLHCERTAGHSGQHVRGDWVWS